MFGKLGEIKKMYDKYKALQNALKNLIIRAKEGKYMGPDGKEQDAIVIDISGEMKLKDLKINDITLLDPGKKSELEQGIIKCFQKAQEKAQEVVGEKTKEILGVDPSELAGLLGGGGIPGIK